MQRFAFVLCFFLPSLALALGDPVGDRPSYPERVALFRCDEARMDPSATGWPAYPAVPPLLWHDALAQSSRVHSIDMRDTPCFQHPSCDGTDPFTRIQMYWTLPFATMGENIAAGVSDGDTVIGNWINEIGAAPGETGHRDNMFSGGYHFVGFGYAPGGTQFQGYWTQDFAGVTPPPTVPEVPVGIHFPQTVEAGGSANFGAVYYNPGKPPDRVEVVIDGTATALALAKGKADAGSYVGLAKLTKGGCHRYYFRAVVGGKGTTYPDAGTLAVSDAASLMSCPAYMAGGVQDNPAAGGGGGGCALSPRASPTGTLALLSLLAIALVRARRRR